MASIFLHCFLFLNLKCAHLAGIASLDGWLTSGIPVSMPPEDRDSRLTTMPRILWMKMM